MKDLIFILDRFGISDNAYNELSIFEKDLPRKTLINQCRDVISKSYKFQRTAGNIPGAYVSFKEELIKYIKSNVSADSQLLKVKISGDGSKVSRISNFIVLSFSIVQNETHLTSLDQNVFCIINCKENYEQLNAACKPVFDEINELIVEKGLFVDGKNYPVEFLFGGDMKFLQVILGLGSSLSTHACPWCRIHKSDRADMSKPFDFYHTGSMARTNKK